MKYIIDIPEYMFEDIQDRYRHPNKGDGINLPEYAVAKGIPLPKGHRFIDADEILNHAFITEDEEGDVFVQKYYCIKKENVDNALVLFDTLEADKEQEDGNDRA